MCQAAVERYTYVYTGDKLTQMKVTTTTTTGDTTETASETLTFAYDASGTPMSVTDTDSSDTTNTYYYATNIQGDVTALLNTSGTAVVEYTYDAWGNLLATDGSMASTLGETNPLRYRGYAYDTETGLYYLQSRYYNPEMGRFLNADGLVSTGQDITGCNMFLYCGSNPVNRADPSGRIWNEIWGFIQRLLPEIGASMESMAPAYAGCGGVAAADGPLPFGDMAALAVAGLLTAGAIGSGFYRAAHAKAEAKAEAIPTEPPSSRVIYRRGGTNPSNLTPKVKDLRDGRGLSFSTVPTPGCSMTTIEALNATGIVYAVQDGPTHVSVYPVGATMKDWVDAGPSSIWTIAVKLVVVKWDGVS